MSDSPRWPLVHVTEISRRGDGILVESAVSSYVCDFCGDAGPSWDYDCAQFAIDAIDFGSLEGWAACTPCSDLIEADDYEGLLVRSLDNPLGREDAPHWSPRIRLIHAGFREHRIGERVAWG